MTKLPIAAIVATFLAIVASAGEIPQPDDAPPPLAPAESAALVKLPPGFRLELVAAEPLVAEPSGVCWDERGRLFVSELHGYNLEGQYDIEALNRTGQLDRVVRRIQADEQAKEAARAGTFGTVKLLVDDDGDGRMDRAQVWADKLPPCYGLCPARGGVIVACAPDIVYLADRDGDAAAEVRETLFTGFATGALERGINCPQWGPDDWIYFGRGHGGGRITGPHLAQPVDLPNTDFRIRADGSAIEPVGGATHTIGFAFTADGERFVISTRTPGIYVAPLAWRYLARNPFVAAPGLEVNGIDDPRVYPISQPHPWRTRRAQDPGFSKYYSERYGKEEAAPNGYFTSGCSPLVYQDQALPGLGGQLLACEPAQNLVHRAQVVRDGVRLSLRRVPGEEQSEFLASADPWFHPMALAHAPDGSIAIVDFYREIIEDYSAIPRYLQQQYGLVNGRDRGRIWRLVHERMPAAPPADVSRLGERELAAEIGSAYLWRRQTARRLLVERGSRSVRDAVAGLAQKSTEPAIVVHALSTLDALDALAPRDALAALSHADAGVRTSALRLAERWLDDDERLWQAALNCADDEPRVVLQLALSLGESRRAAALPALARLAREHGQVSWMLPAIHSGLAGRAGAMLAELLGAPAQLATARPLVEPLCTEIAARRDPADLSAAVERVAALANAELQVACLRGLKAGFPAPRFVPLADGARDELGRLAAGGSAEVRAQALGLVAAMKLESAAARAARLERATVALADPAAEPGTQLAAVAELAAEDEPENVRGLLAAVDNSTPRVRDAILAALLGRREHLPHVLDAVEDHTLAAAALSAVQRRSLLDSQDRAVAERAARLFESTGGPSAELLARYAAALQAERDVAAGGAVFRDKCGKCHQAHGVGTAVGPDLTAEFQRAEETIVRDVLAPSDVISPGYVTYAVVAADGRLFTGLLAAESATSVTLLESGGQQHVVLRKDIDQLRALPLSLMPDDLATQLGPADLANVIAWLRQPARRRVLIDDNVALAAALVEGGGTAEFVSTDAHSGRLCLRVTPPQRYSARIDGWKFAIREKPGPGEYRYLRFAWRTDGGDGLMLELAADGTWPPARRPTRRYVAGKNTTGWLATEVSANAPREWIEQVRDLWADFGEFTLTGIAPTAMGGAGLFDRVELLQTLDELTAERGTP